MYYTRLQFHRAHACGIGIDTDEASRILQVQVSSLHTASVPITDHMRRVTGGSLCRLDDTKRGAQACVSWSRQRSESSGRCSDSWPCMDSSLTSAAPEYGLDSPDSVLLWPGLCSLKLLVHHRIIRPVLSLSQQGGQAQSNRDTAAAACTNANGVAQ